jgi:hypothetical protein
MDKTERLEQFNLWVFEMDDQLENFRQSLPVNIISKLDYSISSLDSIEKWILDNYSTHQELLKKENGAVVDGLARYIGETFRKNIGGHWSIDLDNPKNAYFNLPVITGFEHIASPVCPHTMTTTAANRRTGNLLSSILIRLKEKQN